MAPEEAIFDEALHLSQRGNVREGFPTFLEAGMENRHVTNQHAAHNFFMYVTRSSAREHEASTRGQADGINV